MDLEGQQLLRVHVVERAQVRQLEQQLGEDGRLVWVVLSDEVSEGADRSEFPAVLPLSSRSLCPSDLEYTGINDRKSHTILAGNRLVHFKEC